MAVETNSTSHNSHYSLGPHHQQIPQLISFIPPDFLSIYAYEQLHNFVFQTFVVFFFLSYTRKSISPSTERWHARQLHPIRIKFRAVVAHSWHLYVCDCHFVCGVVFCVSLCIICMNLYILSLYIYVYIIYVYGVCFCPDSFINISLSAFHHFAQFFLCP